MKKAVFNLELHDDEAWKKAIKKVSALSEVDSIFMDMKEKKLTVIGDIDAVHIVNKLRKLCNTEIISVAPAKEPEKKIDRSNIDLFWNHVVKMDGVSIKCEFCEHVFAKRTSISRIKWHLSGEKGRGVPICYQVPKDIQEAAFLAVHGGSKRQKTIASSSNTKDNAIPSVGRDCDEISNFLMENDTENWTGGAAQSGAGSSSSGRLTRNTNEIEGDAPPTTNLVDQAFQDYKKMIWSWLMDDQVSRVGIYGMGGVDLSNGKEDVHRAVKVSEALMNKEKWVLILDDLWNSFELHDVGIPVRVKGCKMILTTQLEHICREMDSQKRIKVEPLSKQEAWTLFMEKLGHDIELSQGVKTIAQFITEECEGLPLAIITMAGTMKGVDDIHEWTNALEDLTESRVMRGDMEDEVFRISRFSYMRLKDSTLQKCFLYCALYPKDIWIRKMDLIAYLIDEGVINSMKSREAEFAEGHSMLNTHVDVYLLECAENRRYVRMHNLIRSMALQIHQENFKVMVKAGAQLKELPKAEEWTEDLVRVSLMQNQIQEIPSSYSPRCPNLSTLLLCSNQNLRFIADSFFKEMHGLKVLDLSHTDIENLPGSVSDLVSLISLLLSYCKKLKHVPSLKKLGALKRLDLSYTALEKMPQDLQCLSELRYLILNGCGEKEFPSGILSELSHLQILIIEELAADGKYAPVTVKGKEVARLGKLENLQCHFEGHSDFLEYLESPYRTQALSRYNIVIGQLDEDGYKRMMGKVRRNKSVALCNLSINRDGDFQVMFPNNIQEPVICEIRNSCEGPSLIKYATELEVIDICNCNSLESLVSSSWFRSASLPSTANGIISGLKEFYCCGCASMKKLFPLVLLPNLVNLEVISVQDCEKMEIIATRDEEEAMGEESSRCYSNIEFNLRKLRILTLMNLPELKSVCSAKLSSDSLEEFRVRDCPKLKRMPIS